MKFEFVSGPKGVKMVKFDCGESYIVQTDHFGMEYFHIPNIYDTDPNSIKLFVGRIGDAIKAVHDGFGHIIEANLSGLSLLGGESVIRFVDEEYGERFRREFIDRTKDFKFAHALRFGWANSYDMPRFVTCVNGVYNTVPWIDELRVPYAIYKSEDAAKSVIVDLERKADKIVRQYKSAKKSDPNVKISDFLAQRVSTILGRIVLYKMHKNTKREEEFDYIFEVAQCVLPDSIPDKYKEYTLRDSILPNIV